MFIRLKYGAGFKLSKLLDKKLPKHNPAGDSVNRYTKSSLLHNPYSNYLKKYLWLKAPKGASHTVN